MFLTIFAVVTFKSFFAGALIAVVLVQWQALAIVLTRPTATGCLQTKFTAIIHLMREKLCQKYVSNGVRLRVIFAAMFFVL